MKDLQTFRIFLLMLVFLGIVSLGVGLSLFSNSLSDATTSIITKTNPNFNVDFTKTPIITNINNIQTGDIIPERNVEGFTAKPAVIDNMGDPKLKDIEVTFSEPGQSLIYTLYASNVGDNLAYLKSITFSNVLGENNYKICIPQDTTTPSLVEEACKEVTISMEVGNSGIQNGSITSIQNHILDRHASEKINLIIDYKINATRTDGPFLVKIGDISLLYTSMD